MVAEELAAGFMVAIWWGAAKTMITDEVLDHYVRLWGAPERTARFTAFGHTAYVYKWDEGTHPEQVNFYATNGASAHQMQGGAPEHRVELFAGLTPGADEIAKALAMASIDPVLHETSIGHGHTITYQEPLWAGSEMCSFLIIRPRSEIVPILLTSDELHVNFLQAIAVFPSEVEFNKLHGADALLRSWQSRGVAFWNPHRSPEPLRPA